MKKIKRFFLWLQYKMIIEELTQEAFAKYPMTYKEEVNKFMPFEEWYLIKTKK